MYSLYLFDFVQKSSELYEIMAYAILRIDKIKSAGSAGGLSSHLERTRETPNADKDLEQYNKRVVGSGDLNKDIQNRIAEAGIKPRVDAVLAIEHIITASPEAFNYHVDLQDGKKILRGDVEKWNSFQAETMDWLEKSYGKENVVNFTVHKDESSPHIHAIVTPIKMKTNARSGKKQMKLCAKDWTGGRKALADMQTSFAEQVKHLGLERGKENSRAQHTTIKEFYQAIEKADVTTISIDIPEIRKPTTLEKLNISPFIEKENEKRIAYINGLKESITAELSNRLLRDVKERYKLETVSELKESVEKLSNELKNTKESLSTQSDNSHKNAISVINRILKKKGIEFKVDLNAEKRTIRVDKHDWKLEEKKLAQEQQKSITPKNKSQDPGLNR